MVKWVKIDIAPNYSVSDMGQIRNDLTNKLLKPTVAKVGYCVVNLRNNNTYVRQMVHRIVAHAFIDNPDNKPTVNHINGIKTDNRASNLEWATYSENNYHAWNVLNSCKRREKLKQDPNRYFKKGHIVTDETRIKMSNAKKKKVMCIETGIIYGCSKDAAKVSKVGHQCITHACNGRCKTAGGYHWKYIKGEA